MSDHCFPPPWSVDEAASTLDRRSFIVRDANGQALAYVYFDGELDRRSAAHLLTSDEARRIAANIAKPRSCCGGSSVGSGDASSSRERSKIASLI
jgi:hypothetical protein